MKSYIAKIAIAGVLAATVSACVTTSKTAMNPVEKAKTEAAVEKMFSGKDIVPKTRNRDKKAILNLTLSKIRKGYEKLDISLIKPILSEKFQYKFRVSEKRYALQGKDEFLKARTEWKGKAKGRKITYKIEKVSVNKEKTKAVVSSFVAINTKYFTPRLFEVLTFNKEGKKWKLAEQAQVPLSPNAPDMHKVNIFLSEAMADEKGRVKPSNFVKEFSKNALAKGADAVIKQLKPLSKKESKYGGTDMKADVIVAFKEPPAYGSGVTVKVKQDCGTTKETYQGVRSVSPYFLMSGQMKIKECAKSVNVKVLLDGLQIAEKNFDIPR